jgi:hypothetical protein
VTRILRRPEFAYRTRTLRMLLNGLRVRAGPSRIASHIPFMTWVHPHNAGTRTGGRSLTEEEERDERVKLDLPADKAIKLILETGEHSEDDDDE